MEQSPRHAAPTRAYCGKGCAHRQFATILSRIVFLEQPFLPPRATRRQARCGRRPRALHHCQRQFAHLTVVGLLHLGLCCICPISRFYLQAGKALLPCTQRGHIRNSRNNGRNTLPVIPCVANQSALRHPFLPLPASSARRNIHRRAVRGYWNSHRSCSRLLPTQGLFPLVCGLGVLRQTKK